jgi:hypothetical protein
MAQPDALPDFVAVLDRVRREASSAVHEAGDPDADYLLASVRLDEAALVAPCVSRFAAAEILPDDPRPAVGRYADRRIGLSRSIGHLLQKRITGATDETRAALRNVVLDAVAVGYMASINAEGAAISAGGDPTHFAIRMDRTPEDIWNWWVVSFSGDGAGAIDTRFRRNVEDIGVKRLTGGLRELDLLPPIGRRTKLVATAGTYATAGLLLRVGQSNNLPDEDFSGTWRHATNQWPYDDYSE